MQIQDKSLPDERIVPEKAESPLHIHIAAVGKDDCHCPRTHQPHGADSLRCVNIVQIIPRYLQVFSDLPESFGKGGAERVGGVTQLRLADSRGQKADLSAEK